LIDLPYVGGARALRDRALEEINASVKSATNGAVSSVKQAKALLDYLRQYLPQLPSVRKEVLEKIDVEDLPDYIAIPIKARLEAGRSSVAKYNAMYNYADDEGVMRGHLKFNGAATGRWSGRGPQLQNLPRPTIDAEPFIDSITNVEYDVINLLVSPWELLASAVRSAIIARQGHRLVVADYSGIEARVLAWLAGQADLVEAFSRKQDTYKQMAASIYSVSAIDVSKQQRAVGKMAILGLGYQMGWERFMGSCVKSGVVVDEEFSKRVVETYRTQNSCIVSFWRELEDGARTAVAELTRVRTWHGIVFQATPEWLTMRLPSGRLLWYHRPRLVPNQFGSWKPAIEVSGAEKGRWVRYELYGGLLTENLVQATARDILAHAMLRVEAAGYPVILTVHDEIISEPAMGFGSVAEFVALLCELPPWARGCPIAAEGWEGPRYRK
jgi:DNA polymerase